MKHSLKLYAFMGFFSILSFQTVKASAAAAGVGEEDSGGMPSLSRVAELVETNPDFAGQVRTALTGRVDPSLLDDALSGSDMFTIVVGSLDSDTQATIKLMAGDVDQEAETRRAEDAASAAWLQRYHRADLAVEEAGTLFDTFHPIFPRVLEIGEDIKSRTGAFVASLKECNDWDVHKLNREKITNVGADRTLFNDIMPALDIASADHGTTMARVRALSERIYVREPEKGASINTVLDSVGPDTTTGEDGLEARSIHVALGQVLRLVEITNEALDNSDTWLRMYLEKIAENKETGGGCMPGILGRMVEVGMRAFHSLATVAPYTADPEGEAAAASGFIPGGSGGGSGGGTAPEETEEAAAASASSAADPLAGATDEERALIESIAEEIPIRPGTLGLYRLLVKRGATEDKISESLTNFWLS